MEFQSQGAITKKAPLSATTNGRTYSSSLPDIHLPHRFLGHTPHATLYGSLTHLLLKWQVSHLSTEAVREFFLPAITLPFSFRDPK